MRAVTQLLRVSVVAFTLSISVSGTAGASDQGPSELDSVAVDWQIALGVDNQEARELAELSALAERAEQAAMSRADAAKCHGGIRIDATEHRVILYWLERCARPKFADPRLHVEATSVTSMELAAAQSVASSKLLDAGIAHASWIDIARREVVIALPDTPASGRTSRANQIASRVTSAWETVGVTQPLGLQVRFDEGADRTTSYIWGGFTTYSGSSRACTTAFALVRSSDGQRAISTAGHGSCGTTTNIDDPRTSGVDSNPATKISSAYGGSYDYGIFRLTSSSDSVEARIYDGFYDTYDPYFRWITGTSTAKVGDVACKYGRSTGYTCGIVDNVTYKPNYSGKTMSNTFVKVNKTSGTYVVRGGDSGGPVVIGTKALGILSGGADEAYFIYMPVRFLPSGWSVLTGP